jgi:hypothetical protein
MKKQTTQNEHKPNIEPNCEHKSEPKSNNQQPKKEKPKTTWNPAALYF